MSLKQQLEKRATSIKKSKFLHTPNHALADEIANALGDKKHFGYYLKAATKTDHNVLRRLLGQVLESKEVRTPGRLFTFLLKQYNDDLKNSQATGESAKGS